MEGFVKGDIVLLLFPFSDFSTTKRRPALIIANFKGNYVVCEITSNLDLDKYSIIITEEDLICGTLNKTSKIKAYRFFTIDESLIALKIGKLKKEILTKVTSYIYKLIAE